MDLPHVGPPLLRLARLLQVLKQARLAQVLINDISPQHSVEVVPDVVWGAILAIAEALVLLEVIRASRAGPCHLARLNIDNTIFDEFLSVVLELFDEVEGALVVGAVPDLYFHYFALFFHGELC